MTKSIYENFAKENTVADLDRAVQWAGAQGRLESSHFGLAFARYVESPLGSINEEAASDIARYGSDPGNYLSALMNDFGRVDILASRALSGLMIVGDPSALLPKIYHFDDLIQIFKDSSSVQSSSSNFELGSCKVKRRLWFVPASDSALNRIYSHSQFDLSYTFFPQHGNKFSLRINEKKAQLIFAQESYSSSVPSEYDRALKNVLAALRIGVCNIQDGSAVGPGYFY